MFRWPDLNQRLVVDSDFIIGELDYLRLTIDVRISIVNMSTAIVVKLIFALFSAFKLVYFCYSLIHFWSITKYPLHTAMIKSELPREWIFTFLRCILPIKRFLNFVYKNVYLYIPFSFYWFVYPTLIESHDNMFGHAPGE